MEPEFPVVSLLRQMNEFNFLTCIVYNFLMRATFYSYLLFFDLVNVIVVNSRKLLSSSVGNLWIIKTKYNI
jgi:hypothetical protein